MNYRQRHKKPFPWVITIIILIIVGILLVRPPFPESIRERVFTLGNPIWSSDQVLRANVQGLSAELHSKQSLLEDNEKLRNELTKMQLESLTNNILREENRILRERFNRLEEGDDEIVAAILKRPNTTLYDTFVIDGGLSAGIHVGMLVISEQDVAIGRISHSYQDSALVTLFSAPGETLDVLIRGEVAVIAEGKGAGNFTVSLPRDVEVEVGDPVILPTLAPTLLAEVAHIEIHPTDPFKTIFFRLPIQFSEERFVFVVPYAEK